MQIETLHCVFSTTFKPKEALVFTSSCSTSRHVRIRPRCLAKTTSLMAGSINSPTSLDTNIRKELLKDPTKLRTSPCLAMLANCRSSPWSSVWPSRLFCQHVLRSLVYPSDTASISSSRAIGKLPAALEINLTISRLPASFINTSFHQVPPWCNRPRSPEIDRCVLWRFVQWSSSEDLKEHLWLSIRMPVEHVCSKMRQRGSKFALAKNNSIKPV